jgi:hypothetical protein
MCGDGAVDGCAVLAVGGWSVGERLGAGVQATASSTIPARRDDFWRVRDPTVVLTCALGRDSIAMCCSTTTLSQRW